ncbi:hypothetical protein RA086_08740 [Lactiplantibacillus sp. WILCCON 0030]|uniref:Extracellular protein n=1 Tax=Lactiplantibacillus brownii TaxID=3069269 RepID=A0ABU1A9S2_9LACO|nr:hypothetical protein [Lactiplantibacillus brownii]MDQ7937694.1 hypothetical protein [Lactiplantibacillus brownii]
MNKRLIRALLGLAITILGLVIMIFATQYQPATTSSSKPASNSSVMVNSKQTPKPDSHLERKQSSNPPLTDQDVIGVWINHHNKSLHQKITFFANHKWQENQQHVTNIYSGTWKITTHNEISLAPYGEKIRLYGTDFKTMTVLNYNHRLDKQHD